MVDTLIDGPDHAAATVLLAHGAGAPMDSPFMQAIAAGLAGLDWRVVRFEFPYMAQRRVDGRQRAPDRLPRLLEAFRAQVDALQPCRALFIGGKSMGGRIASLLIDELAAEAGVRACLCLGYPVIALEWVPAGDHSFKPTRSSGLSEAGNWQMAVEACDRFMRPLLSREG